MSETQALLARISALRQRLEQTPGLTTEATETLATLRADKPHPVVSAQALARQVAAGREHDVLLDAAVRSAPGAVADEVRPLPRQLTARARRVLEKARLLLGQLRVLSDAFAPPYPDHAATSEDEDNRIHLLDYADPLSHFYRETTAIADTSLRMIPVLPDSATGQMHLCDGLEGILNVVAVRVATLDAAIEQHRHETGMVTHLAGLLSDLEAGKIRDQLPFLKLAEEVHLDAEEGNPLRFLACDSTRPARFVAAHSLTVARVLARVVRYDNELKNRSLDVILAALVHDAGMLRVPPALLALPQPLSDEQRRVVEAHCRHGAQLIAPLLGEKSWLVEATQAHHERLDGTGYPDGLRRHQISSLTRLLAVGDCYVSMCTTRPYRPARETRTALADTLLLADQGQLDRDHAQHLLQLSFYPVGTAVEMADGAVGVVVATPSLKRDLNTPARPVVALLLDADGKPLPLPRHLDLARCDNHSIVRTLSPRERRELLGQRYPEWIAA